MKKYVVEYCGNTVAALMGLSECNYWLSVTEMTWRLSFTVNLRSHLRSWRETCVFNPNQTTSYSLVIKPMIQWAYFTVSNHVNSQLLILPGRLDPPFTWLHAVVPDFSGCASPLAAARIFCTTYLQAGRSTMWSCFHCAASFNLTVTVTHGMSEWMFNSLMI